MFSRHLLSILDGDGLLDDLLLVSCQELDVDSSGAPTRSSGKNLNMVDIAVTRGVGVDIEEIEGGLSVGPRF